MNDPTDALDFRKIFESTPSPYLILDPDLTIVAVNEAYLEATMTEREEIVGCHIFDVFPDDPDDSNPTGERNLSASLDAVRDELEADSMAVQRYPIRRPDGTFEVRHWSPKNVPVLDDEGELYAIIHRVEDVTETIELKEQEDELASQVTDLEAELYERGQEIQHKKKRLEKAYAKLAETEEQIRRESEHKDEFLAMLSHEIRNPMAAISTSASLLAESPDDEDIEEAIATIQRQVAHMRHLVDDLLDVSRIVEDRIELQRESVSVGVLLEDALDANRQTIERHGQDVEIEVEPSSAVVEGDRTRLVQVFSNLLDNASKYGGEGGEIRVDACYEEGGVVVRVSDDGRGIAPELLPDVFDRFKQADTSLHRTGGGLGLGLTLVDELVRLHGGRVDVESGGRGEGSTFTVRLPASLAERSDPEQGDESSQEAAGRRVLIVDDNPDIVGPLERLLELDGHDVAVAQDGESAVESAREFRPDVAVIDIGLPEMDGFAVAERLREMEETADAELFAMTGYGREGDRLRSERAGFDRHLVKPVDPTDLSKLLSG